MRGNDTVHLVPPSACALVLASVAQPVSYGSFVVTLPMPEYEPWWYDKMEDGVEVAE